MKDFRCEHLWKTFDGVDALADLSIELSPARITAIIGPNGAGKTTLLNVLTGFIRPEKGRCLLGGHETTFLSPYKIARLGVARTFQDLRLIFRVSAIDNILLARPHQRGERLSLALLRIGVAAEEANNREMAMRLLSFVGLEQMALDLARDLSYGQQKLLTLACCLATDARILLFDEPVAGVHPTMAEHILELLGQLRDQGRTIVFVEHDISAVRRAADRVIVMDQGRVIADGPPREVLERREIMEAYLA